jgi:hypothetical protein
MFSPFVFFGRRFTPDFTRGLSIIWLHLGQRGAGMTRVFSLLLLGVNAAAAFSPSHIASAPALRRARVCKLVDVGDAGSGDKEDEFRETDADSAADGPKVLMPPKELLNVMPSEADSFAGYLAPYAFLVLLAFGLASAAFALLVSAG